MKKYILTTLIALLSGVSAFAHSDKSEINVSVTEKGFEPKSIDVKAGSHVVLNVTRKTDSTCAKEIQIPSKKIAKTELPLNKMVSLDLGEVKKGEIRFGCGMMMETAQIHVN